MMDYEQKYKEALEWMKSLYNGLHGATKEEAEKYFPELKESEDEKIRKALVRFHKSTIDVDGIKGEEIVAWLEKQSGCFAMWKKNTTDNKPTLNHSVLMKSIHGFHIYTFYENEFHWHYVIDSLTKKWRYSVSENKSNDEAVEAALKFCIKNLI